MNIKVIYLVLVISVMNFCYGQTVAVNDVNLETYLESNSLGNGITGDNLVTQALLEGVDELDISGLGISNLEVIKYFTNLEILDCSDNNLTSLDVSKNTLLEELYIEDNSLTELDLLENTELLKLDCSGTSGNAITSLGIYYNTKLTELDCSDNDLKFLDLSNNNKLVDLDCSGNDIQFSLDVSNKDTQFTTFDATGNTDLTCIQVDADDLTHMNDNLSAGKDVTASYSTNCTEIWIPDANFETYLETHDANGNSVVEGDSSSMGNGTDGDHIILKERVNTVLSLDIHNEEISNIQGIEQFEAMTSFDCSDNDVVQINLWNNLVLENLDFHNPSGSEVTTYVGLNSCPELLTINGAYNLLSNISLHDNTKLTSLNLSNNNFTNYNIDLANNTMLESIDVSGNTSLSIFDLTSHTALVNLNVSNTGFSTITGGLSDSGSLSLGSNTSFTDINFSMCSFSILDLSSMTFLVNLNVSNSSSNVLVELNIKNGNNNSLSNFDATTNSNLLCVEVDTKSFMDNNFASGIDGSTSYSANCATAGIEDSIVDTLEISIENKQVTVNTSNVEIYVYNFLGMLVKNENLSGIYIVKIVDKNNKVRVEKFHIN